MSDIDVLDLIDAELAKASAPQPSRKPLFLFLKDGRKATIRPLRDLRTAILFHKHSRYSEDPKLRVGSICAKEEGKPCLYCQMAQVDKKLGADQRFYLPVYVYGVVDTKTGEKVTYSEKDEHGVESQKLVCGLRVLELSSFGRDGQILKAFRSFMKDPENCRMTECDFTISQEGQGTNKAFITMPKQPKPMSEQIASVILTTPEIRKRILESLPPFVADISRPSLVVAESTESSQEPQDIEQYEW